MKNNDRLYNVFMELIGQYSNEELLIIANNLIEYVKNDL